MILYNHMAVFACIAQQGSITGASDKLELPKSTVSLKLKELEEQLGIRLIQRTTRTLTLTEHGQLFYEHCQEMLSAGDAAARTMQGLQDEPRGNLKLTCPFGLSDTRLHRTIARYCERYPRVKLEVRASNTRVDIIKEGIDIALRLGTLEDSSLVARKVTECRRWALASPRYLEHHNRPNKPHDLTQHRCIVSSFTPHWRFTDGKKLHTITPTPHVRVTDVVMARELAIAGVGICMLPDILLASELDTGALVPVLPDYPMEVGDLNLLYPSRKLQSSAIKRFIDTALEVFQTDKGGAEIVESAKA